MQFGIGIRIVAFISLALGVLLLSVTGWTYQKFVTGEIGQNVTLPGTGGDKQHGNNHHQGKSQPIIEEFQEVTSTFAKLKKEWEDFKPFLMGSGGLAIVGGIVQVITTLAILCSGPKGARSRSGFFKMSHFVVAVALLIAIIIPAVFDVTHDSLSHKLKTHFDKVQQEFSTWIQFENGFNPDVVTLYYAIIAVDICGIFSIIFCTCCLMRNAEYDYREYP